jgi:predicted esterase
MRTSGPLTLLLCALLSLPLRAHAQADAREQLALAYLQLEMALAAEQQAHAVDRAALNREFDRATLLFFAGNMSGALAVIDSMAAAAGGDRPDLVRTARERLDSLDAMRRTVTLAGRDVPYLLHLPAGEAPAGGWPVIVAVHGAGGDERMFFGGYGAGVIRSLADTHGVAVLSPAATVGAASLFDMVDAVATGQPLQVDRVALVGHSMGAGVVARAAAENAARTAAVVCLAGSCSAAAGSAEVPVLVMAGALDPLFRVGTLAEQTDALRVDGRFVEFHRLDAEGHTLVVGVSLPQVFTWLEQWLPRASNQAMAYPQW